MFAVDAQILLCPDNALLGYLRLLVSTRQIVVGVLNLQGNQFTFILAEVNGLFFQKLLALIFVLLAPERLTTASLHKTGSRG